MTTSTAAAMRMTVAMTPPPATPLNTSSTRLRPSEIQPSMRSMIEGPARWNSGRDNTFWAAS